MVFHVLFELQNKANLLQTLYAKTRFNCKAQKRSKIIIKKMSIKKSISGKIQQAHRFLVEPG